MKIRYAAKTDVGMKRSHNEDYFSLHENERLFIVADGMGGHSFGELASKMAADTMGEFFERTGADDDCTWPYKMDRTLSYVENRLVCSIKLANLRIYEHSMRELRFKGMGTTIVTGLVCDDRLYVGHVGDSRAYRLRKGEIKQLTRDHSLLEEFKEAKPDMTEEEERNFPHKNVITRALGMRETVQVEIHSHDIEDGDLFLLCSDGLSGMVTDAKIREIAERNESLDRVVDELIDAANRAGGTDNVTTLVIQCFQ